MSVLDGGSMTPLYLEDVEWSELKHNCDPRWLFKTLLPKRPQVQQLVARLGPYDVINERYVSKAGTRAEFVNMQQVPSDLRPLSPDVSDREIPSTITTVDADEGTVVLALHPGDKPTMPVRRLPKGSAAIPPPTSLSAPVDEIISAREKCRADNIDFLLTLC